MLSRPDLLMVIVYLVLLVCAGILGVHLINGTNEEAHIRDSVAVIGHAFVRLLKDRNITDDPPVQCKDMKTWRDGPTIVRCVAASGITAFACLVVEVILLLFQTCCLYHSSQCSTTGLTKAVVCIILYMG